MREFENIMERLYRLKVFKYGQIESLFIILDEPAEIHDVVDRCKKYCAKRNMRFMGVSPLFETLDE